MQGHKLVLGHNPTGLGMNLLPAAAQAAAPMGSQRVDWTSHFPARFLQPQHSAGSSALSTETAQHPHVDSHHSARLSLADERAAAAARPVDINPSTHQQLLQASRTGPHAQQLLHAMHIKSLQLQEEPLPAPAAELQPARPPAHQHFQLEQEQDVDMADAAPALAADPAEQQLEGQDSADGLDLLMLVIQAAEKADAEQAVGPQPQQQQHDPAAALLAACASAQAQDGVPVSPLPVPMQGDHAGLLAAAADDMLPAGNAHHAAAGQDNMQDAAARDAHMRHAIAATLAAVQSRAAQQAAAGPVTRSRDGPAQAAAGPSSRPKRAAAVEGEILRTVMMQEEAASKGPGRRSSSHSSSNSSSQRVADRLKSLELAAHLHQQREQQLAGRPPLPHKKRRSSSPAAPVGRCGGDGAASLQQPATGLMDPAPAHAGTTAAACAGGNSNSNSGRGSGRKAAGGTGSKQLNAAGSGSAAATDPELEALTACLQAAAAARDAARRTQSKAVAASWAAPVDPQVVRAASTAVFVPPAAPHPPMATGATAPALKAPGAAKGASHPATQQAAKVAAAPTAAAREGAAAPAQTAAASTHTGSEVSPSNSPARQAQVAAAAAAAAGPANAAAMQRAAAGRPPRRSAAARASQQIAATGGTKTTPAAAAAVSAPHKRNQPASSNKASSLPSSRGCSAAISRGKSRTGRPAAQAAAGSSSSSSSSEDEDDSDDPTSTSSSSGSDDTSDSDTEFRAASRKGVAAKRSGSKPATVGPKFTTKEDGGVVVAAGKRGPKGGRPLGAGNKNEMQPRSVNAKGEAAYGCRSQQFRGVYMCQRMTVRWRTQFSYARKVLNVGSYQTEEDAARAWNAAAMHFRGGGCWVNPVEPVLPEDQGLAIAASLPQPEGGSLLPAAISNAG